MIGTRVQVRVTRYDGPDDLRGLLVFGEGMTGSALFGARLVKVAEVNLGVTMLTFEAKSEDGVNGPMISASWDAMKRQLEGEMPKRSWINR